MSDNATSFSEEKNHYANSFRELKVYQEAMLLSRQIYEAALKLTPPYRPNS